MGLKTTTVGWFPKPAALLRARWRFAEGEIERGELDRTELAATESAVALQESLGLDLLVDGQMDRGDGVSHFAGRISGMEAGGLVRCYGNRYYRRPRIVGEIAHERPVTVDHWKAARSACAGPLKAILTGPYTLMDWSFDEHYDSREACCMAFAEALRSEAAALVDAGASEIQIDEAALGARPEEVPFAAEALGRVTAAVEGRARRWAYLGYGDLAPHAEAILALPVDGLLLEMVNSDYALLDALGDLPPERQIAAGVIDVHDDAVETGDILRARVERLLQKIPAERLWLTPDAGLRTLAPAAAESKLRAMVQVAAAY